MCKVPPGWQNLPRLVHSVSIPKSRVLHALTFISPQVLLVGVLGEDRITCIDEELGQSSEKRDAPLGSDSRRRKFGFFFLFKASALFVTMCVSLLTSKAAQNMAAWTFHGDHCAGAVVGLVLCALAPAGLFAWERHRSRQFQRLIEEFPPAGAESDRLSRR